VDWATLRELPALPAPPKPAWARVVRRVVVGETAGRYSVVAVYADGFARVERSARRVPAGMALVDRAALGPIRYDGRLNSRRVRRSFSERTGMMPLPRFARPTKWKPRRGTVEHADALAARCGF
jgi:hypothetical protein